MLQLIEELQKTLEWLFYGVIESKSALLGIMAFVGKVFQKICEPLCNIKRKVCLLK